METQHNENKENSPDPPKKRLTRAEHEKKKDYWRERKKIQRAQMSSQKKRRIKEYDRKRKRKQPDCSFTSSQIEVSINQQFCNVTKSLTKNALKQKVYRVKKSLPKSPRKFAQVIDHLVKNTSPRKKASLEELGLTSSQQIGNELIHTLKENVHRLNGNDKRQHKWRIVKRCLAFSLKSVKRAKNVSYKQISQEVGIGYTFLRKYTSSKLEDEDVCDALLTRKKRSDALENSIVRDVQDHFTSSASFVPDRKSVSKKTLEPKMVLSEPVSKLYSGFQTKYPHVTLSKSQFHRLRPKNVQTTYHRKLYQSKCEYCSNSKLKLGTLNKLCEVEGMQQSKITNLDTLIGITLCPKQDEQLYHPKICIKRECKECGTFMLVNNLKALVERVGDRMLKWNLWTNKKFQRPEKAASTKKVMISKDGTLLDMIQELEKELKDLPHHMFVAKWQKASFDTLSKSPPAESIVMHLDFSENYSTFYQEEISSAHWMKNLITVHPLVAFYNCPDCESDGYRSSSPVMDVLIFLTDDNKHDHHAVQAFMTHAIKFLKEERNVQFSKVYEFTDGCSSQYKSRGPLVDISFGIDDFGVNRERNYFGSCHGKGPSDGAGAVTKMAARRSVIRHQSVITNAESMFGYLNTNLTRKAEINNLCNHSRREYFLIDNIDRTHPERMIATSLQGTRQIHSVRGISPGVICTRDLACTCIGCIDVTRIPVCRNEAYVNAWATRHLNLKNYESPKVPTQSAPLPKDTASGLSKTAWPDEMESIDIEIPVPSFNSDESFTIDLTSIIDRLKESTGEPSLASTDNLPITDMELSNLLADMADDASQIDDVVTFLKEAAAHGASLFCADIGSDTVLTTTTNSVVDDDATFSKKAAGTSIFNADIGSDTVLTATTNSDVPVVDDEATLFAVGTHIAIQHGVHLLPAVITSIDQEVFWIKYYACGKNGMWSLQEKTFSALASDFSKVLEPPNLLWQGGSRFYYTFNM